VKLEGNDRLGCLEEFEARTRTEFPQRLPGASLLLPDRFSGAVAAFKSKPSSALKQEARQNADLPGFYLPTASLTASVWLNIVACDGEVADSFCSLGSSDRQRVGGRPPSFRREGLSHDRHSWLLQGCSSSKQYTGSQGSAFMLRSELHGHRHSRTDCRLQIFTNNQHLSTQRNYPCSRFEPRASALSLGARTSTEFSSCIHPTSRAPDL